MYDMSQPNETPGKCGKCKGSGTYSWGTILNGVPKHSGPCHSCGGKGHQTAEDIARDKAYNRHKVNSMGWG